MCALDLRLLFQIFLFLLELILTFSLGSQELISEQVIGTTSSKALIGKEVIETTKLSEVGLPLFQ